MDISDISLTIEKEVTLRELEKMYLEYLLTKHSGNKTLVAKKMGLSIKSIRNKVYDFDLYDFQRCNGRSAN